MMNTKISIDGLRKKTAIHTVPLTRTKTGSVIVKLKDSHHTSVKKRLSPVIASVTTPRLSQRKAAFRHILYQKTHWVIAVLAIVLSFVSGMWVEWDSPSSTAAVKATPMAAAPSNPDPSGNKEGLFTTPIRLLQQYISSSAPDAVIARAKKLKAYLETKNSPLASYSGVIAQQEHWKFILAISFAESTLGKRCYQNNCSGIGGSNIKAYDSTAEWIMDFNSLLDKRYKDDTLEDMCGVYVKPCTNNWLSATKQILSELDDAKID